VDALSIRGADKEFEALSHRSTQIKEIVTVVEMKFEDFH
jgi:hypothetical protein